MLSAVLRSETAIIVTIQMMITFIQIRKFLFERGHLLQPSGKIEQKQIEPDHKIESVFAAGNPGRRTTT